MNPPLKERGGHPLLGDEEADGWHLELHREFNMTDPAERACLRAELDALVAHLYALTEDEFAHILSTFPLVAQGVKDAALAAYHQAANGNLK